MSPAPLAHTGTARSTPRPSGRLLQVALQVLLVVCIAQVVWWTLDQWRLSGFERERLETHHRADLVAAGELERRGLGERELLALFPHLELVDGKLSVAAATIAELDQERTRRMRRYLWEGGFFIAVLLVAMRVVWRAVSQERELYRRQENFVAAVSHELKSPLASLQLSAETMALRDLPRERHQVLVERILDDVERLGATVSKILAASRLEHRMEQLVSERFELAPIVRAVLGALESRAVHCGVQLQLEVPPTLTVIGDAEATTTVIHNLVENACKAAQAAGGGMVEVTAGLDGSEVRLEVHDDGIGFDSKEATLLFEKFYRSGDEMRRTSTGTGLGLYLVAELLRQQRGRVEAHSAGPGRGARFVAWWPAGETR